MNIRKADENDAVFILDYLSELSNENCETITSFDVLPTVEEEKVWLRSNDGTKGIVFILEDSDGKVYGMLNAEVPYKKEFEHTCEFGMSVLKEHRAKGYGAMLLEALVNWAKDANLAIIALNVFSNNLGAQRLYEKFGFKVDGERVGAVVKNGRTYNLIHMSLTL